MSAFDKIEDVGALCSSLRTTCMSLELGLIVRHGGETMWIEAKISVGGGTLRTEHLERFYVPCMRSSSV